MLIGRCSGVAISLATVALIGVAAGSGQPVPAEKPRRETVAKLIAQLGAPDFRSREQARNELEKLGGPVLPALRKAATANPELEVKRRLELVVSRIENALLNTEEKRWQDLDAPRRGIKDRLVKILAKTPALTDDQVASAVYLLTVGRPPTDKEVTRARKQFAETNGRTASTLQLTRSLVQGKEFRAEVAAANGRLFKAQKDLATEMGLAKRLGRLADAVGASLDKVVKTDKQFVDLAFLLVLSRFPKATEANAGVAHLKKATDRSTAKSDIFWALMNSTEFGLAP